MRLSKTARRQPSMGLARSMGSISLNLRSDGDDIGNENDGEDTDPKRRRRKKLDDEAMARNLQKSSIIRMLPRELSLMGITDSFYDVRGDGRASDEQLYRVKLVEVMDCHRERGIYTGTLSRRTHQPHGEGLMKYHVGGRSYDGQWERGKWQGRGIIYAVNGDVYDGAVSNFKREGRGVLKTKNGATFDGVFVNDEPNYGKMKYPDNSTYTGMVVNNQRHGFGFFCFADGSFYEGAFDGGVFHGSGKMVWPDGGWYEGGWNRGEMEGMGTEIKSDGSIRHAGMWKCGTPVRES